MSNMDISGPVVNDDLAKMTSLDAQVLVNELEKRYNLRTIYTYIGDILIAVNPFQNLGIYGAHNCSRYANSDKDSLPPHIYATADQAYSTAIHSKRPQVCIVSGESGAGKTETTKLIIEQILSRCGSSGGLNKKIAQMSPVLEAFGNAQTVMNHNSSRFGKFLELQFLDNGSVQGGVLSEFLLERSRVVHHAGRERNFHVFYYLCCGLDASKKAQFQLGSIEEIKYLSMNKSPTSVEENAPSWNDLTNAMSVIGFTTPMIDDVTVALSAILHFGNIVFEENGNEEAQVSNEALLSLVAQLLMVQSQDLINALITKSSVIRNETIVKTVNAKQAYDFCGAAAKSVYGRLFQWIVHKINKGLSESNRLTVDESANVSSTRIGLLDIFGFENFERNSFEQICINLANEHLQFFFNEHVFKQELEEFAREGLGTMSMTYVDNQPTLDLFNGKSLSVLKILNEESRLQSGSASSLGQKLSTHLGSHPGLKVGSSDFTVIHYAGRVDYKLDGLIEKNRDNLPELVTKTFESCGNSLVKELFTIRDSPAMGRHRSKFASRRSRRASRRVQSKRSVPQNRPPKRKQLSTVATVFIASLDLLVETMSQSQPHFVRCIKPNKLNEAKNWDNEYVSEQLKYTGMLETVRIRKEGFAVRLLLEEFLEQYGLICFSAVDKLNLTRASAETVLNKVGLKDWLIGKTKVFLKYFHLDKLRAALVRINKAAITIQSKVRCVLAKRQVDKLKALAHVEEEVAEGFLRDLIAVGARISHLQDVTAQEDDARVQRATTTGDVPLSSERLKVPEPGTKQHRKFTQKQRKQSQKWFKQTQAKKIRKSDKSGKSKNPSWFHGYVDRDAAEFALCGQKSGTFLVRVNQGRKGYTLTLIHNGVYRHYKIIEQDDCSMKFDGVPESFPSIGDLIDHYESHDVSVLGDRLLYPQGKVELPSNDDEIEYAELVWDANNLARIAPNEEHSYAEPDQLQSIVVHAVENNEIQFLDGKTIFEIENRYGHRQQHNASHFAPVPRIAIVEENYVNHECDEDLPQFRTHTMILRQQEKEKDAERRILEARMQWRLREKEEARMAKERLKIEKKKLKQQKSINKKKARAKRRERPSGLVLYTVNDVFQPDSVPGFAMAPPVPTNTGYRNIAVDYREGLQRRAHDYRSVESMRNMRRS